MTSLLLLAGRLIGILQVNSNLKRRVSFYFFPIRKVLYALKTRKRENDVFVCFFARVRIMKEKSNYTHDNTAVARKPRKSG